VKILLMTVVALVVLVGAVLVVGTLLPQDHLARSRARFASPPDSIWSLVRNLGGYAEWWPEVKRVEPIPGRGHEAWNQIDKRNGSMPMEILDDQPPQRLVTRIIDEGLPFGGTWTYEIAPEGSGSRVTITEDGSVYNPLFRVISRFVMGHHGTMDNYLKALGAHLGEVTAPEHLES